MELPAKMMKTDHAAAKDAVVDLAVDYLKEPQTILEEIDDIAVKASLSDLLILSKECIESLPAMNCLTLTRANSQADLVLQYVWEHLNVGHWKSVDPIWRKTYSYLNLCKIIFLISSEKVCLKELTSLCDLGLLIGDDIPGNILCKLAATFHQIQRHGDSTHAKEKVRITGDLTGSCGGNKDNAEADHYLQNQSSTRFVVPVLEKPSLETFFNSHMTLEKPAVLSQAMGHWPALTKWKPEYICQVAGCRTVPVEIGSKYTSNEWTQKLMTIEEFVQSYMNSESESPDSKMSNERKGIGYIAQHQLFHQIPELKQDIHIPEYCFLGENKNVEINAWFGPGGTVSPTHYDPKHNLLSQVFGKKVVRLFPPSESQILRPYEKDSLLFNTSRMDIEHPELFIEYPEMLHAKYADIVLQPGNILYIPPKWWHFVKSLSPSFSVSFWFD